MSCPILVISTDRHRALGLSDGSRVRVDQLIANSKFGPAPDTYNHGALISNVAAAHSHRDNKMFPIVGGRGNDTISGSGEIRGMQGDDYQGRRWK